MRMSQSSLKSSSEGCQRAGTRRLLGEAVERLAVLASETLGELEVLGASLAGDVGEARSECAHVFLVEVVPRPELVRDPPDELVADAPGAHTRRESAD